MKKFLGLSILLLFTVSCTTPVERIKTSVNDYYWFDNRFQEKCPSMDSKDCPALKDEALNLQKWNKAIHEAQEAAERGGKYPLQLKSLKDVEKAVKTGNN